MATAVIFGGSGFVGTHLVRALADARQFDRIVIADIRMPGWHAPGTTRFPSTVKYVPCDVRRPIPREVVDGPVDCIVNLAAVHTSPGHEPHEYFEANILGARHVCEFAEAKSVRRIVFTSSISVYGPGEDEKTEESVPMPAIPYGSSKIVAEYIHREWFHRGPGRMLCVLRPAVIFGRYEGGNFTRIAGALRRGIFAYPGRTDTIKGCVYVKDLCRFIVQMTASPGGFHLYNFCYPEKIAIRDVVGAFRSALGYRAPEVTIPLWIVNGGASILNLLRVPAVRRTGLVPERIAKLVRSTNISSRKLIESGFRFEYDLVSALRDWAGECGGGRLY